MKRIISSILILIPLTGCLSTYKISASGPTARVKTLKNAVVSTICINETQTRLSPDKTGYAIIPAGNEIMMTAQNSEYINGASSFCIPAVKFTPTEGSIYIQKFTKLGTTCSTEIYRQQDGAEVLISTSSPGSFGCSSK